jgi:hypothetical protein
MRAGDVMGEFKENLSYAIELHRKTPRQRKRWRIGAIASF